MMDKELAEWGLHSVHSSDPDREPIDFEIRGDRPGENYACVYGSHPTDDVICECWHDLVEYYDDDTVGQCPLCGATCDWHWEIADGNRVRVPHEWYKPDPTEGIIGRELKRLAKEW